MKRWYGVIGLVLVTMLLGAFVLYANRIPVRQMAQGEWVLHTHAVLAQLELIPRQITEAKVSPSTAHTEALENSLSNLGHLTQDNPAQQKNVLQLRGVIDEALGSNLNDFWEDNRSEETLSQMRQEETRLLEQRMEQWYGITEQTRRILLGGVALLYGFVLFSYWLIHKESKSRETIAKIEANTSAHAQEMLARMTQVVEIQQDVVSQRLNLLFAMEVITKRIQEITHADGAVIEMLDGDEMVYRAASGNMVPYIGFRLKAKGSLTGLCIEKGVILRCDETETDPRVDKEACRKVGVRSMIVVPLYEGQETVGVLKVCASQPNAFTTQDEDTLYLMAGVLSATLRDAAEIAALKRANKQK